jgi:hypothetical protein
MAGQKSADGPVPDNQSSTFQVKTDLLSLRQDIQVMPEDMKIGPLRQKAAESSEIQGMKSGLLIPFFVELTGGKFPESLVIKENSINVKRDLEETVLHPEFGTVFYRLGVLIVKGDTVTTLFRIKGANSDYTGTLYLKRGGDRWLVEDVEIGLSP